MVTMVLKPKKTLSFSNKCKLTTLQARQIFVVFQNSPQMLHVWIICLYYIDEKWPHARGNVGKYYPKFGASGKTWHRNKIKKQLTASGSVVPSHTSNQEILALLFSSVFFIMPGVQSMVVFVGF